MTEPVKPQIDARQVALVQEGFPYEYIAGVRGRPRAAVLFQYNELTGDVEIIPQDILRCAEASRQIKKLATDGKDLYLLFDNSSISEQIGKVIKVKGKYRIQFIWLNPGWGPRIEIKDLILEGGRVYARVTSSELFAAPQLFDLARFKADSRDLPCHLDQ